MPASPARRPVSERTPKVSSTQDLKKRVATLEVEARFREAMISTMTDELFGIAPEWPEEAPASYRPEAFQDLVDQAVEECDIEPEIISVDCREPPCMLVTGEGGRKAMVGCAVWSDEFGDSVTSSSKNVECPDGTQERFEMFGPYVEVENPRPEDPSNGMKRLRMRAEEHSASWPCLMEG